MPKHRRWSGETARSICQKTQMTDPILGSILLAEQWTKECGVSYSASKLDFLASWQGAKINRCDIKEAGQLIPNFEGDPDFWIFVNQNHSRRRQNFSICHEFGHLLMPNYDPFQNGKRIDWETMCWSEEKEEELLCDIAAAEIIMPRREFLPRLRGTGLSIGAVQELSEEFDASLEATAVNIVRSGFDDVAVIVWSPAYDKKGAESVASLSLFSDNLLFPDNDAVLAPAQKKLRVKFALGHGKLSEFFFPRQRSVEDDSCVGQSVTLLKQGLRPTSYGIQLLKHSNGASDFYVESLAYWAAKDDIMEVKVISLVFENEPHSN